MDAADSEEGVIAVTPSAGLIDSYQNNNEIFTVNDQIKCFQTLLASDDNYQIPSQLYEFLSEELLQSEGSRIRIRGNGLKERINDKDIQMIMDSMLAANMQVQEISLPYHRITGKNCFILVPFKDCR